MADSRADQNPDDESWQSRLARRCASYVASWDRYEARRTRSDRIGGRMLYTQHWLVSVPRGKAAVSVNASKALVRQKLAIMTKSDPIFVVEPNELTDSEPARRMNLVLQHLWKERNLRRINRRAILLSEVTRTSAIKVVWDKTLGAGAGDVAYDVIPGYRMIVDNRATDVERMQYIGDRAIMPRTRAMILYPKSSDEIAEWGEAPRYQSQGGLRFQGSPITDPWNSGVSLSTSDAMTVNSVPVLVTPSMVGPSPAADNKDDDVEVVELYHKDLTRYNTEEVERDGIGNPLKDPVLDDDGIPQFDVMPDEVIDHPEAGPISVPNLKLREKDRVKKITKAKYPFWRRTTMLFPGNKVIQDRAWDGPAPYSLYTAEDPLDGCINKGPLLDLFTLQGVLNTGVSENTNNIRQGSMQAFLLGAQSGIDTDQIILTPGKAVRGNDISEKSVRTLQSPHISSDWMGFNKSIIDMMKFVYGLEGIMQGQAPGRMDNAAGVDTLAEISGAQVSMSTDNMGGSLARLGEITGWFVQKHYDEKHTVSVENEKGQLTWMDIRKEELAGNFSYNVSIGSAFAWSESAQEARVMARGAAGLYDKIEMWQQLKIPGWQKIRDRLLSQPPVLSGQAGAPPVRTRSSPQTTKKPTSTNGRAR